MWAGITKGIPGHTFVEVDGKLWVFNYTTTEQGIDGPCYIYSYKKDKILVTKHSTYKRYYNDRNKK